jgi:hypothetical protein
MEMEEEEMMEQPEEQSDMDRAGDDDDWFHFRADANATGGGGQQVHGQSGLMPQMVLQKAMDSQAGHKVPPGGEGRSQNRAKKIQRVNP